MIESIAKEHLKLDTLQCEPYTSDIDPNYKNISMAQLREAMVACYKAGQANVEYQYRQIILKFYIKVTDKEVDKPKIDSLKRLEEISDSCLRVDFTAKGKNRLHLANIKKALEVSFRAGKRHAELVFRKVIETNYESN